MFAAVDGNLAPDGFRRPIERKSNLCEIAKEISHGGTGDGSKGAVIEPVSKRKAEITYRTAPEPVDEKKAQICKALCEK
jgi:hypothetical protein